MNRNASWVRRSLWSAGLVAGSALAQSPVITDVALAPPEYRESVGAVVMEDSMVLAQRKKFPQRSTPAEVQAIGREVIRKTMAEAQARGEPVPNTRALGGSPGAPTEAPPTRADKPR
jgi:hypothetical protein